MTASTTGFRPEIQGLRALAILGVVGFHAMPGIFPGGFVGVDIFFVISGYLITRTLLRDVEARRYSIPMFYARRIARLFPALFLMFAVVTVAALAILPPAYLREFFATLSASSAFVANLHFGQHVDYFAEAADLQPLLHTWSLSIEEQFYIVYPIILVALIRLPPWARVGVMVVALWGSLAWATIPVPSADFLRFYSPFTRAYELLIGCVLAIRFDAPSRSTVVSAGEVIFGGSLIATSLLLFAPGQDMPSWRALVPCLGCALVIHGARGAPARLLAPLTNRPAQFFGDISYSLYLWHWPVLVFGRLIAFGEMEMGETAACLGVSVLLAWLSFRFVESPVLARGWEPRVALPLALTLILVAALPRAAGIAADGWPERFSAQARAQFADRTDFSPLRSKCHTGFDRPASYADHCQLGATGAADTLIWSDSMGTELAYALQSRFRTADRSLREATGSSCPPILADPRFTSACVRFNQAILRGVSADPEIRRVILAAHYLGYEKPGQAGLSGVEIAHAMIETAQQLRRMGKEVIVLLPLPSYSIPVPDGLGVATHLGLTATSEGMEAEKFKAERRAVVAILLPGARESGSRIVDPAEAFCDTDRCRISDDAGKALYFDRFHPSVVGARLIVERSSMTTALGLKGPIPIPAQR